MKSESHLDGRVEARSNPNRGSYMTASRDSHIIPYRDGHSANNSIAIVMDIELAIPIAIEIRSSAQLVCKTVCRIVFEGGLGGFEGGLKVV